jgi:hypothetical protein
MPIAPQPLPGLESGSYRPPTSALKVRADGAAVEQFLDAVVHFVVAQAPFRPEPDLVFIGADPRFAAPAEAAGVAEATFELIEDAMGEDCVVEHLRHVVRVQRISGLDGLSNRLYGKAREEQRSAQCDPELPHYTRTSRIMPSSMW